jgi:hypothetical protein
MRKSSRSFSRPGDQICMNAGFASQLSLPPIAMHGGEHIRPQFSAAVNGSRHPYNSPYFRARNATER